MWPELFLRLISAEAEHASSQSWWSLTLPGQRAAFKLRLEARHEHGERWGQCLGLRRGAVYFEEPIWECIYLQELGAEAWHSHVTLKERLECICSPQYPAVSPCLTARPGALSLLIKVAFQPQASRSILIKWDSCHFTSLAANPDPHSFLYTHTHTHTHTRTHSSLLKEHLNGKLFLMLPNYCGKTLKKSIIARRPPENPPSSSLASRNEIELPDQITTYPIYFSFSSFFIFCAAQGM